MTQLLFTSSLKMSWLKCMMHVLMMMLQMLEKEKEENRKLQQMLEDKDRRIAELEKEVSLLNKVQ